MDFFAKVLAYCQEHQLIEKEDKIVAGISGGADSVCLFLILLYVKKQLGIKIYALHVNHQLRGKEADEDEYFVKDLCKKYQIPLKIVSEPVEVLAKKNKQSTEEAGRELRYRALEAYRKEIGADKIAVAHHKNDQAETVLYHLCRGSGLEGLTGMLPQRERIIRPLLSVTRREIEDYLKQCGQAFQTDSTNLENTYTRNKLRNQVIPYLEREVNQQTTAHIAAVAELLGETASYIAKNGAIAYSKMVEMQSHPFVNKAKLDLKKFCKEDVVIQKWVIKKILSNMAGHSKNLEQQHILDVIALTKKQVGKKINLPYNMIAWKDYGAIQFEKQEVTTCEKKKDDMFSGNREKANEKKCLLESKTEIKLSAGNIEYKRGVSEKIYVEQSGRRFSVRLLNVRELGWSVEEKLKKIPKNNCTKWFDCDKIVNTVIFRKIQDGDYLQIDQAGHRKFIKKVLKDGKVSARERNQVWVFADGDHVLWVPGIRSSEYYRIEESTDRILEVRMDKEEES